MTSSSASREALAEYARRHLFGPAGGGSEAIEGTPFLRYMLGILYPKGDSGEADFVPTDAGLVDAPEAAGGRDPDQTAMDQLRLGDEMRPSAAGLSVVVSRGAGLRCEVSAGRYVPSTPLEDADQGRRGSPRRGGRWERVSLGPEVAHLTAADRSTPLFDGTAQLVSEWREWEGETSLVTVTVVNSSRAIAARRQDPASALFQVALRCEVMNGHILPYPAPTTSAISDEEDLEVAYLYREIPRYARGHGVAATWKADGETCTEVAIDFMPQQVVPQATFELAATTADPRFLEIEFLAECESSTKLMEVLRSFVSGYRQWIASQREDAEAAAEPLGLQLALRASEWADRMSAGVELLKEKPIRTAFQLANRAMGMQMRLSPQVKQGPFPASDARGPARVDELSGLRWRPFQVAFALGVLPSLVDPADSGREVVDVIWFPTGGGKTEAYLLVAAFELVRRRLAHGGDDRATAVISRYTLRLLTSQQFERTGVLIAALELIRRSPESELGERPFSLGLWVGEGLTPNRFAKALEIFDEQRAAHEPENKFLLTRCPMCGTEIFPERSGVPDAECGIRAGSNTFEFFCPSGGCIFHDQIPLQVVDDALYRDPPSILLGTLDKFAGLPWNDRPIAFFGDASGVVPPPSLVIQDELHLISGPLGSLAAPYDVAIDAIIRARTGGYGPKLIASTATIRNAREQVRGLYGRVAAVFPSPIRRWDDAYFFSLDHDKPGRLYVGVMGQGYVSPTVAAAWTVAAVLQGVQELPMPDDHRDGYWSLLAYTNSRRELGRLLNAASDEIPARLKVLARAEDEVRGPLKVMELSSQMTRNMSEALATLGRPHTAGHPAVDLVPCTSMISVGVDVDRLGIMLMNGQPKLSSEYIQATSRVGRSDDAPGIVLTLYSASKPRDRSHYEDFRSYHEALYRFVEPTSVTPYAPPARQRTLHAAVVAVVRYASQWLANDAAAQVDFDEPGIHRSLEWMLARMSLADPQEAVGLRTALEALKEQWADVATGQLLYEARSAGPQFAALLRDFSMPPALGMWPTMRSVRNVDPDIDLRVVSRGGVQ